MNTDSQPQVKAHEMPLIKAQDMPEDMQKVALETAKDALNKFGYDQEKEVAAAVKKKFEVEFKGAWHCIVGRSFGSFVAHQNGCFIYFYLGKVAFLLFK